MNLPFDCQLVITNVYIVSSRAWLGSSLPFPASLGNLRWGNAFSQKLEVGDGVPLRPMAL